MALPRPSEAAYPERQHNPVAFAQAGERAGNYSIEQLEMLLQPLLVAAPPQRERVWMPAQTVAFAVVASTLLWSAILFVALRLL